MQRVEKQWQDGSWIELTHIVQCKISFCVFKKIKRNFRKNIVPMKENVSDIHRVVVPKF